MNNMEDQYNLIYNGKMLHGMDGYAKKIGSAICSMDTDDKPGGCAGSYVTLGYSNWNQDQKGMVPIVPYINTDTYKLSFQYKDNGSTASRCYCAMMAFDNKGKYVNPWECHVINNTVTTLARDLNDGDTVIYLTSVANWSVSYSYYSAGIIESAAWKDNRSLAKVLIGYGAIIDTTNNTITLGTTTDGGSTQYAWSGGTYKAGSKIREFGSGGYIYPMSWDDKPSSWTSKERTFTDSNLPSDGRLPFAYFLGIGYLHTIGKFADLRFENLSRLQPRVPNGTYMLPLFASSSYGIIDDYSESQTQITQQGQANVGLLSEGFLPVRYIRDSINGSTQSASNVWYEIQAFDRWGRNVAFAADGELPNGFSIYYSGSSSNWNASRYGLNKDNTTTYKPLHVITQGTVDTTRFISTSGWVKIDMGVIHYIDSIKIWHYYYDDRTFHNTKTEVSVDGVNWITVFDSTIEGEYVETADGHTITFDKSELYNYNASFRKGGEVLVNDVIED